MVREAVLELLASPVPATALLVGAAVIDEPVFDVDELLLDCVFVAESDADDDELSVCALSAATATASDENASAPSNNPFSDIVWWIFAMDGIDSPG